MNRGRLVTHTLLVYLILKSDPMFPLVWQIWFWLLFVALAIDVLSTPLARAWNWFDRVTMNLPGRD